MSLTQALNSALSGLNAAQTGLSLVAGNVANAQTPGYVRKTATLVSNTTGTVGAYVQVGAINRVLDQFVQAQLRTESAGAGYATLRSNIYDQLQSVYGNPNSTSTLENAFNNFTTTLQALTTSPGDRPTQIAVISAAQGLAQTLNQTTSSIQTLRSQAELGLSDDVTQANDCLQQIAALNLQLGRSSQADSATAGLEDQRDSYIDKLSNLMDIRVVKGDNRQVTVFTTSGVQLVGTQASTLSFDPHPTVNAQSTWSADRGRSHARHHHADLGERHRHRSGRDRRHPVRRDRRLSRHARQRAGAGAGPGRPVCRRHVERAVGHDDRRHGGDRRRCRPVSTSISAACRTAIPSASPTPTTAAPPSTR